MNRERPSTPAPSRRRPLLPVLAGLAAGVALDGLLQPGRWVWPVLVLAVASAALWGLRRGLRPWGHWVLAAAVMLAFGGFWHEVRFRRHPPGHLANLDLSDSALYRVRGRVGGEPVWHLRRIPYAPEGAPGLRYWSVRVEAEALSSDGEAWQPTSGGLSVFVHGGRPDLDVGDRVEFLTRMRRNRSPTNPGERNRALAYERRGSYATASVPSPAGFRVLRRGRWYGSPSAAVGRLRGRIRDGLARVLPPQDGGAYGLVAALVFGRRSALSPRQERLLKESGTLHFLAISGLHVGLFFLFVHFALALAGVPVRARAVASIALIWAYVLFTGAHVSAVRAGLMLSLMVAAPVLERQWDSLSALCAAAVLILLVAPQQLFMPGFQLTFVAVLSLICIYPQLSRLIWPWRDFVERVAAPGERSIWTDLREAAKSYLLLSCVVWAATAPLRAYYFGGICPWGPLLNLLMWPLVFLLLLTCFMLAGSVLLGGLGAGLLAAVARSACGRVEGLLEMASHLPGFYLRLPAVPAWWVALCYVAMALWVLRDRLPAGRRIFLAAAAAVALGYVGNECAVRLDRRFRLVLTDVGKGQALLAETPEGPALLFDAGARAQGRESALADVLRHYHVGRLGAVVVSHLDGDHCGFIPLLSEQVSIERVLLPASASFSPWASRVRRRLAELGLPVTPLEEGSGLAGGGLDCTVLHPNAAFVVGTSVSENDRSLVIRCDYAGLRVLLTGDIEQKAMRRLVSDYGAELRADVLVMPHHAHHHEGLEAFLAAVQPRVALVSGGEADCHPRTAALLRERGVGLWITGSEGAIIVTLEGGAVRVTGQASGRSVVFPPRARYP